MTFLDRILSFTFIQELPSIIISDTTQISKIICVQDIVRETIIYQEVVDIFQRASYFGGSLIITIDWLLLFLLLLFLVSQKKSSFLLLIQAILVATLLVRLKPIPILMLKISEYFVFPIQVHIRKFYYRFNYLGFQLHCEKDYYLDVIFFPLIIFNIFVFGMKTSVLLLIVNLLL